MSKFRLLTADEIECRVARCTAKGAQLLLYKDARCDMNILDETVGAANWQRKHEEHRGNLFCSVGIKEDGEWIWKEDAGAESNTEAEKGHASDSFKRACVNWGIGRELYTSPFIWVSGVSEEVKGKWVCKQSFTVANIGYDEKRQITSLTIADKDGNIVYQMGRTTPKACTCERCKKEIKAKKCGGKLYTPKDIVANSMTVYGGAFCWECMAEMKEAGM